MNDKYEQAVEKLMEHFGFVWYNESEWLPHDDAYFRASDKPINSAANLKELFKD